MISLIYLKVMDLVSKIEWGWLRKKVTGREFNLKYRDWLDIASVLDTGYYIILSRRKSHLTTYLISIAHFILTGKFGYYSHALCNIESKGDKKKLNYFKFIEAIGKGVVRSDWYSVFNCDSVCILKPKYYSIEQFNSCVSEIYDEVGKGYDDYFKLNDGTTRSCVELARERMIHLPDYFEKMRVFEYMIKTRKNLTPQMFRDCPDFEILLEIKR